jgi:hypothetical protein
MGSREVFAWSNLKSQSFWPQPPKLGWQAWAVSSWHDFFFSPVYSVVNQWHTQWFDSLNQCWLSYLTIFTNKTVTVNINFSLGAVILRWLFLLCFYLKQYLTSSTVFHVMQKHYKIVSVFFIIYASLEKLRILKLILSFEEWDNFTVCK